MNQQTRTGLAPKSWGAVVVWLVIIAVVVSRPAESVALVFSTIRGTGQWLAYTAFADCGEAPPMDWMTVKECPPPPPPEGATTEPIPGTPGASSDDGQAVARVDGDDIRRVLDDGTQRVKALHVWAADAQRRKTSVFVLGTSSSDTGDPQP